MPTYVISTSLAEVALPLPFGGSVKSGHPRTFSKSADVVEASVSFRALVNEGHVSVTVTEDVLVPDSLEVVPTNTAKVMNNKGIVPSARLHVATNPSDTNTVVIGGHTFTFKTTLAAAGATTQVKILGTAALSRSALVDAINGVSNVNVVPATTPHTVAVVADVIDTDDVRVRLADQKGGVALAAAKADADIAVSETLADAADVWDRANLDATGHSDAGASTAMGSIEITAAMITATKVYMEFPFTPVVFTALAVTSAGAQRAFTDTLTIESNAVKITLAGGASPNLQAGDIVTIFAST
jgi:hypothetical protein